LIGAIVLIMWEYDLLVEELAALRFR